jgi:hypothetical protein
VVQEVEDGYQVEVRSDSKTVVVRGGTNSTYPQALLESLSMCHKGLDLIAMRRGIALAIERPRDKHVTWWEDSRGRIARAVSLIPFKTDAPPVTVTVSDQSGRERPQPEPVLNWHPSLRYFRLSQITSDLIDAYRNMFLAIEALLSDIRPKQPGEGERAWLIAAFQDAHSRFDLSAFGQVTKGREGEELHEDFAEEARHQINHAKLQRNILLPHEARVQQQLADKLRRLGNLFLKLCESYLGIRRVTGGMFSIVFRRMMDGVEGSLRIVATDDRTSVVSDSDRQVSIADGASAIWIPASRCADYDSRTQRAVIAVLAKDQFASLRSIGRYFAAISVDEPFAYAELGESLVLDGIDVVELVLGLYHYNVRVNRSDYAT